jgi:metacaspase-1
MNQTNEKEDKMAKGFSLHIGLNRVDSDHYNGWSGPLRACEADAQDMQQIAQENGYDTKLLLTNQATRNKVTQHIQQASETLEAGDIFFVSYSGHGGQVPDFNGDEEDGMDETWCLFDGQLIDDELSGFWAKFSAGVRILVLSDSCHSGTVTREAIAMAATSTNLNQPEETSNYRFMPSAVALRTYRANKAMYKHIADAVSGTNAEIKATVRLISGCQDNQYSQNGVFNGLFTGTLLGVWNEGKFQGNYQRFHKKIVEKMPSDQTPNLFVYGADDPEYANQRPFEINAEPSANDAPSAPTNLSIKT